MKGSIATERESCLLLACQKTNLKPHYQIQKAGNHMPRGDADVTLLSLSFSDCSQDEIESNHKESKKKKDASNPRIPAPSTAKQHKPTSTAKTQSESMIDEEEAGLEIEEERFDEGVANRVRMLKVEMGYASNSVQSLTSR